MRVDHILIVFAIMIAFSMGFVVAFMRLSELAPAPAREVDTRCQTAATLRQRYNDAWRRWSEGYALRDCDADALADVDGLFDELCEDQSEWCQDWID